MGIRGGAGWWVGCGDGGSRRGSEAERNGGRVFGRVPLAASGVVAGAGGVFGVLAVSMSVGVRVSADLFL